MAEPWHWKAPRGISPEEMKRQAEEAIDHMPHDEGDGILAEATLRVIHELPNVLGREVVIESIDVQDGKMTIAVIFPDEHRTIYRAGTVYPGVMMQVSLSDKCPDGWIRVKFGVRVWVEWCSNGAGSWQYKQYEVCAPPDWILAVYARAADGSPSKDDRSSERTAARKAKRALERAVREALRFPEVLRASMYRTVWDMMAALGLVADAYQIDRTAVARAMELLLSTYPNSTEYDLAMALSDAANADDLLPQTRLLLEEAAGEILRKRFWQCIGLGAAAYSPNGYPGGGGEDGFDASSQSVSPDQLLDAVEALLKPYLEDVDREVRSLRWRFGARIAEAAAGRSATGGAGDSPAEPDERYANLPPLLSNIPDWLKPYQLSPENLGDITHRPDPPCLLVEVRDWTTPEPVRVFLAYKDKTKRRGTVRWYALPVRDFRREEPLSEEGVKSWEDILGEITKQVVDAVLATADDGSAWIEQGPIEEAQQRIRDGEVAYFDLEFLVRGVRPWEHNPSVEDYVF